MAALADKDNAAQVGRSTKMDGVRVRTLLAKSQKLVPANFIPA